ncbi:MAG: DEAD/DEAH box helicase [Rikenellaceae bacterium]
MQDKLKRMGIESLNSVQNAMLSDYPKHEDIMLVSSTGSGKTLAYLLPMLEYTTFKDDTTSVIIVVPTRELALQIEEVLRQIKGDKRVVCCYGGHKADIERRSLATAPHIVVGTVGRLLDHIKKGVITTRHIETVILDEFDKSLEMGFIEEMGEVFDRLVGLKKRILISATNFTEIPAYVKFAKDYHLLDFVVEDDLKPQITSKIVEVEGARVRNKLFDLICEQKGAKTIVFCNYREVTEEIAEYLERNNIEASYFHGAIEQKDREWVMTKFKNHSCNVLVTTDLAARGIDVDGVECVIHYQMPQSQEAFIHRNGRTARMGGNGVSYILHQKEMKLSAYVPTDLEHYSPERFDTYEYTPEYMTIYIGRGKKDKLSRIDVVGFFCQKGGIEKSDIGMIDLKDYMCYVAVKRTVANDMLKKVSKEKIKGKKCKIVKSM